MTDLPECFRLRQRFTSAAIEDLESAVSDAWKRTSAHLPIKPGQRVAIGVGSRGIANLAEIVAATVDRVKSGGGIPIIIPAMGSHGRATAEGQEQVLRGLGIAPESMGCEVRSVLQPVTLGELPSGLPVCCDAVAAESDHVIIINRIKPHTRLVGRLQSGLVKMLLIGLGKNVGAAAYHRAFADFDYDLESVAADALKVLLSKVPIRMGLAVIEDAFDEVSHVEAVTSDQFLERERVLLDRASSLLPKLPFGHADLLIIDHIGKEISGTGMDTNVIGRKFHDKYVPPGQLPRMDQIFVRGLTEKTAGNATGIGIAEYCRSELVEQIDRPATWINCLTGRHVTAASIPMHFDTDREVLEAALTQSGSTDHRRARWMWIANTLRLDEVVCSETFLDEARRRDDLEVISECQPLGFDDDGQLIEAFQR